MTIPLRIALAAALLAPVAAAGAGGFSDRVGTLALSQELDARGNLGGITVDRLGFLYIANFRDAVWRISPEGGVETLSRALYGASGNAVDSRGDLYQASFFGNTITRISRDGEASRFVDRGLAGPVGMVFDADDNLYVCNCNGNSIARVTPEGEVDELVASDLFACPNGITLGPDESLYVTNFNHHDIVRVSKSGEATRFTTSPGGAGNAHIAFSKGFFYVTKIIANRLVKISADGEVFPLAGTGQPGHDDGPAAEATFFRPNGIAASPQGDRLYVNTMVGEYSVSEPSRLTLRTVDLVTLTEVLEGALDDGGLEAVETAYAAWRADPVRGRENTVGEMVTLGYRFLSGRQVPQALAVFRLNAGANPGSAAAQYHFGEAYRYVGQAEPAAAQYRKTLEIQADHALAKSRLEQLAAPPSTPAGSDG